MTIRAKIIAAVERRQRVRAKRIAKLDSCDLEVIKRAVAVFESPQAAGSWLIEETDEAVGLHGKAPIDLLATTDGRQTVLHLLGRIEHGISS